MGGTCRYYWSVSECFSYLKSTVLINPDLPESRKLKSLYDSEVIHLWVSITRYIMVVLVSDPSGGAWFSVFNEQPEKIIGAIVDEIRATHEVIGVPASCTVGYISMYYDPIGSVLMEHLVSVLMQD
ncbi:hypothetical protein NE237_021803 [Protea cynaroides]|uniref:Uncharacterized protein n=1 Tax=Protea cynaroides TaxID=273540 RepID=A0A9Q0K579_9MAGN|nr:hypothetical protein NE237_021803 [Protea cynaroides]